jgi:hypothetical protein
MMGLRSELVIAEKSAHILTDHSLINHDDISNHRSVYAMNIHFHPRKLIPFIPLTNLITNIRILEDLLPVNHPEICSFVAFVRFDIKSYRRNSVN